MIGHALCVSLCGYPVYISQRLCALSDNENVSLNDVAFGISNVLEQDI